MSLRPETVAQPPTRRSFLGQLEAARKPRLPLPPNDYPESKPFQSDYPKRLPPNAIPAFGHRPRLSRRFTTAIIPARKSSPRHSLRSHPFCRILPFEQKQTLAWTLAKAYYNNQAKAEQHDRYQMVPIMGTCKSHPFWSTQHPPSIHLRSGL